jgi:WD40 repeat protein
MEYVEGRSITKYCDEQKLNIEQRLKLFREVCEGVHHAHQKGIIHRDIKPSNILVSIHGDRAVPKIIDFGIAKAITQPLTEKTSYTEQGQLLGTPEYMSPEQAEMSYQDVDTRSDIYSLGVLLYELLTGAPPFDAKKLREGGIDHIQKVICEDEPRTPSAQLTSLGEKAKIVAESRRTQIVTLTRCLHRELEWIPMKAMRKDRTRRYRSASELADDIQNYLTDAPLIAGPESNVYRARKFVRKHAGSVATAALLAVIILLGLVVSTALSFRAENARKKEVAARTIAERAEKVAEKQSKLAEKQRKLADEQRKLAEEQRKVAEKQADKYRNLSYVHSVALADAKYREHNLLNAQKLLSSCPEDLRNWEWYRLNYVMDESLLTFGSGGGGPVALAFSPDGKRIARGYVIWDAKTGTEIRKLKGPQHESAMVSLEFSPDGKRIISGAMDNHIKVWDANSGEQIMILEGHETIKGQAGIVSVDLSADGSRIVSIDRKGMIKVWVADSGEELLTINTILGKGAYGRSVAISPDGKRIIAGRYSKRVNEWDAATGEKLRTFRMQDQSVHGVEYSPDGKQIAMGFINGMIKIVDTETEKEMMLIDGKYGSLAFSPDGKRLVTGGEDQLVRVWDIDTGKELTRLVGHPSEVTDVMFSPDGQRIASSGVRGTSTRIWDPSEDREIRVLKGGHTDLVRDMVFSPDGKLLISAGMDKTIKIWDVSKGEVIHTFSGHEHSIWSLAISPDSRYIVSGSRDNTIRIWDIDSGEQVRKITGHNEAVLSVVFSPDGKRIASAGDDVKVWDAKTGEEVMTLPMDDWVGAVAFSPDGQRIVSGGSGSNGVVKIWDATTGEELRTLSGHMWTVRTISFTPNGKRIISGSYDSNIRIWDVETGDELTVLYGHTTNVEAVAVSPDGKRIVSGSFKAAKVWDTETGAELMTLPSNGSLAVAFSPDGKTIAGSDDNEVILWQSGPRPNMVGLNQSN